MPIKHKGFSLADLPTRKDVLKHNLKTKLNDLKAVENKLNQLKPVEDKSNVIILHGKHPDVYIPLLEEEKEQLITQINEIKRELTTL